MRLGVTQRIYYYEAYDEYWECLDSRLYTFLRECGFESIGLSCTQSAEDILEICDGIVLSGGNDIGTYKQRDIFEHNLIACALNRHKKILGICRGMQMIAAFFGSKLKRSSHAIGYSHELQGVFNHRVTSFHNYTIDSLPYGFSILASVDNEIEAIENGKSLGIMWHPEREVDQKTRNIDKQIITSFFRGDKV